VGGDEALAQRLHGIARDALGLLADGRPIAFGVGIADGRLTALVAAHAAAGRYVVVEPGESARCLAQLPVSVLADFAEIDRDVVSLLHRLGLSCLGDLVAMKPSDLVGRFGPVGLEVHRLSRGFDRHPPITIAPPPERASTHRFELSVEDVNVVVSTARQVADELVTHLSGQGVSCVRLHICMQTDHGEQSDRLWYQPEGLTAAAMAERVRWQMEAWIATRGAVATANDHRQPLPRYGATALWGVRFAGVWLPSRYTTRGDTTFGPPSAQKSYVRMDRCKGDQL
jgi:protein ImuB